MADDLKQLSPGAGSGQRNWGIVIAVVASIAIIAWTALAWNRATALGEARLSALIEKEKAVVEQEADAIRINVGRSIAYLYGIPSALADNGALIEMLTKFGRDAKRSELAPARLAEILLGREDLMAINRHLALVNRELGSDVIFVMNASGDCVAASNYDSKVSLVGGGFADREYFQQSQSGAKGRQYAMGRVTNVPGLFFSAPVLSQGQFVGAVAVKIDLPKLAHWVDRANAFVVNGDGVVILARDKNIEMRALDGAPIFQLSEDARQAKYKRRQFEPMRFAPEQDLGYPGLVRMDNSALPYVMTRREVEGNDVAVYVVSRLDASAEIRRDTQWAFVLIAFSGIAAILLLAGGAAYLVRASQHRHSMEQANAALSVLNAQLRELASTDALTGCANRRQFLEKLRNEMARATRYGGTLSVIALDLDHFKNINDTHGHGAGDDALKHFADLAQRLLRTQDTLGRTGGEEFAILLPDTNEAGAVILAERLREQLEHTALQYRGHAIPMTVSAGVAERRQATDTPEDILKRADEALYAAKGGGRNRVIGSNVHLRADQASAA
jgi:diguanylate cyclase (GGDEF)-like protein